MADRDPQGIRPDLASRERSPARFTADEFDRMIGAGAFADMLGSMELVRGELVRVNSKYLPRVNNQYDFLLTLVQLLEPRPELRVRPEPSVRLSDDVVCEPDIVIFDRQPRGTRLLPGAAVHLVVEIAATTLTKDLGVKLEDYARAGVPRLWVVDLGGEVAHDCTEPTPEGYASRRVIRFGEPLSLAPLTEGAVTIPPGGFD